MIWILLAALGVPLWLVVGALLGALWSRRAFMTAPGVFPAKLRLVAGETAGAKKSWPRMPRYARWVHDVLVVHQGFALVRSLALPVASPTGELGSRPDGEITRLGDDPVVFQLRIDSGAILELAAPVADKDQAVGPYAGLLL